MTTKTFPLSALAIGIAAGTLVFSSCTQYQQQGAAVGALGGAALGAITGDDSDDVIRGAAIGAGVGAGAAALKEQNDRRSGYYNTGGDQPTAPPPPPAKPKKKSNYPLATPHPTNPSQVISPYKPHNVITIKGTGLKSGDLSYDPSTAPIDPATNKPDYSRAKIFELP